MPKAEGSTGPDGYFEFLQTVQQDGAHGEAFGYRTVNTDTLGWIVSRVEGQINGTRLFPAAVVDTIRKGGDRAAFAKAGYTALEGGSYRSMWWVFHNQHGAFAARGVHGQTIYVDPTAEMVIVRFASHPSAKNSAIDPTSLPAYQAVAEYLMSQD